MGKRPETDFTKKSVWPYINGQRVHEKCLASSVIKLKQEWSTNPKQWQHQMLMRIGATGSFIPGRNAKW